MKRSLKVLVFILTGIPFMVQAGGLMTNTNQSASYIRMPVLDAIIGPEGGYYNPAGLSFLQDGFYISVSNQTIAQKRTIQSTFPGMNRNEFEGTVSAPLFPTAYLTYKQGPLAFSVGVNPIGGGGSALFEEGLPSFEQQVAVLPAGLTDATINTTHYSMDTRFDAQSLFWGIQGTASYAFNDMVSAAVGLRYVTAKNTYDGYLNDIMINPDLRGHPQLGALGAIFSGGMTSAPEFFRTLSDLLQVQVNTLSGVATSLQPFLNGMSNATLSDAYQGGFLNEAQVAQISGGILQLNPQLDPSGMTLQQIHGFYQGAAASFQEQQSEMEALKHMTANKEVSVTQTGTSLTPIIGVNLRLSDRINLALKYEHKTPLTVKNNTDTDGTGLYPEGAETAQNLPAMLSVGGQFGLTDRLTLQTGIHYYFDKSADYGKALPNKELIDKNFWEAGLGMEYQISPMFLVSAGYLRTQTGVNDLYHSDMSHSLSTNTIGAGFKVQLNEMIALNLGGLYSQYIQHTKAFASSDLPTYSETYDRSNIVFAVGVDLKF